MWLEDQKGEIIVATQGAKHIGSLNGVCPWVIDTFRASVRFLLLKFGVWFSRNAHFGRRVTVSALPNRRRGLGLRTQKFSPRKGAYLWRERQRRFESVPVSQTEFQFVQDDRLGNRSCTHMASLEALGLADQEYVAMSSQKYPVSNYLAEGKN